MRWTVKYSKFDSIWDLAFPPHFMDDSEQFHEFTTMADVLAEAIEGWLPTMPAFYVSPAVDGY